MSAVARAFLRNPVFFLGVVSVAAVTAQSEGVISGPVAVIVVAVVTFTQRHFVTPDQA